jgi:hypothetical protein
MSEENEGLARLERIERDLETYGQKIGLKIPDKSVSKIEEYLSMSGETVRKLHPIELAEIGLNISSYLVFFQKEYNRHKVRYDWAYAEINRVIAEEFKNVVAYNYEERKYQAISSLDYATRLEKIRVKSQAALNYMNFIDIRLTEFKKSINDYRYAISQKVGDI